MKLVTRVRNRKGIVVCRREHTSLYSTCRASLVGLGAAVLLALEHKLLLFKVATTLQAYSLLSGVY